MGVLKKSTLAIFHTPRFDGGTDHIDVKSVINIAKTLPSTHFVLTHIGHKNLPHEKLVDKVSLYKNISVAFDGLEMEV